MAKSLRISPIRTLHVDIEGGWGGSSRSLFELLRRVDRERINPVVIHRQSGPAEKWYREIGIPAYHVPEVGSFVPRAGKAARNLAASLPRLARLGTAAVRIAALAREHEARLIHLNYEGLFLLGRRLARLGLPIIVHSRALLPSSGWGRWVARSLTRIASHIFFISPQEERRFRELCPDSKLPGEVLWNIARPAHPRLPFAQPPEAVALGSLDRAKGTDRLLDIAVALRAMQAPPLRLAVYGLARTDPRFASELAAKIERQQLGERIALRGFSEDPMAVMACALALIRPSRENDPWGRDVIEAAAAGLPVLATGTFAGVVRHEKTGFLFPEFDAVAMADRLVDLLENPARWQQMSAAAVGWADRRFSGREQANRFVTVVERLAGAPAPFSVS